MLMQGWLRSRRLWRARKRADDKFACKWQWPSMWHVLRPGSVDVYQTADGSELLMRIQLCEATKLVPFSAMSPCKAAAELEGLTTRTVAGEGVPEVVSGFYIIDATGRSRYFHADNSEILEQWIQAFQVALSLSAGHPSAEPLSEPDAALARNDPAESGNDSPAPMEANAAPEEDLSPDLPTATTSCDSVVFKFRFLNYNMANNDFNLDRLGNGFAAKRELSSRPDTTEDYSDTGRCVPFDELIAQGVPASLEGDDIGHRMTSEKKKKLEKANSLGFFRSKMQLDKGCSS